MARLRIRIAAQNFVQHGMPQLPPDTSLVGLEDQPDTDGNIVIVVDDPHFEGCYAGQTCKLSYTVSQSGWWDSLDRKGQHSKLLEVHYDFHPTGPKLTRKLDNVLVAVEPNGTLPGFTQQALELVNMNMLKRGIALI